MSAPRVWDYAALPDARRLTDETPAAYSANWKDPRPPWWVATPVKTGWRGYQSIGFFWVTWTAALVAAWGLIPPLRLPALLLYILPAAIFLALRRALMTDIRGESGLSTFKFQGRGPEDDVIDAAVRAAVTAAGLELKSAKQAMMGMDWKISPNVWISYRHVGTLESKVGIRTEYLANVEIHCRLKGHLLALLAPESAASHPVAAPSEVPACLQLDRGQAPLSMHAPPKWATARREGGRFPRRDARLPVGGPAELAPGYWYSEVLGEDPANPPRFKPSWEEAWWTLGLSMGWLLLLMSLHVFWDLAMAGLGLGPLLIGVILMMWATPASDGASPGSRDTVARSVMRVELGRNPLDSLAERIEAVLAQEAPSAAPVPPLPGALRWWQGAGGQLQVTVWPGVKDSAPLVELRSIREPTGVARLKGALEAALYSG